MRFLSPLALFLSLISAATGAEFVPCPFNKEECICLQWYECWWCPIKPNYFDRVQCNSKTGQFPKFEVPTEKYVVKTEFKILDADARKIVANAFAAFESIWSLVLIQKPLDESESRKIDWDDNAFLGVGIGIMTTDGLDGLIPAQHVMRVGQIQGLQLINHGPVVLEPGALENLPDINHLKFEYTKVQIKPGVFAGLENQLGHFEIRSANFTDLANLKIAIKDMKRMSFLGVTNNSISCEINGDTFPNIPLANLDLSINQIPVITKDAFIGFKGMHFIFLDYMDPLGSIDLATFANFDTDQLKVALYWNKNMKHVEISEVGKFPANPTTFDITNTGVETIDSKLKQLIDENPNFNFDIRNSVHLKCDGLEWMSKIKCPDKLWVDGSRCADKGNQKLVDYLKSVDPESICNEFPRQLENSNGTIGNSVDGYFRGKKILYQN